jgi:hypothetical protein
MLSKSVFIRKSVKSILPFHSTQSKIGNFLELNLVYGFISYEIYTIPILKIGKT